MRKELRYHPHIYQEIKDGYDWYESRASGLGEDFLKELERAYSVIQNLRGYLQNKRRLYSNCGDNASEQKTGLLVRQNNLKVV